MNCGDEGANPPTSRHFFASIPPEFRHAMPANIVTPATHNAGVTMKAATIPTAWRNDAPLAARTLTTEQAAAALHIRPQTLRAALCRDGHYFGVRPIKGRNRFLFWPADAIERLTAGGAA
jgi:hypothetical protein